MAQCQYGTQKKSTSPEYTWMNLGDLWGCTGDPSDDAICQFISVLGTPILVPLDPLCGDLPPECPPFTITDFLNPASAIAKATCHGKKALWQEFCECKSAPPADPGSPPPGQGQCSGVRYRVYFAGVRITDGMRLTTYADTYGAVGGTGSTVTPATQSSGAFYQYWIDGRTSSGALDRQIYSGSGDPIDWSITSISRLDGQADNCGQQPTPPEPPPAPTPPEPPPALPPPPPPPGISMGGCDCITIAGMLTAQTTALTTMTTGVVAAEGLTILGAITASTVGTASLIAATDINVTDRANELQLQIEECCDETLERLDYQISGTFETGNCEGNPPGENGFGGKGFAGLESQINALGQKLELIREASCDLDAIAVVPEWWELRPEANRPQLIISCGEVKGNKVERGVYPITIPHAMDLNPPPIPFTNYQKGNWEGILTLKDNSKVIVNAISLAEAERVLDAIRPLIEPAYLIGAIQKIGQRKGQPLKTIVVAPKKAAFFPNGIQSKAPSWRYKF